MKRKALAALAVCGIIAAGVWLLNLAIIAGCHILLILFTL